MARQTRTQKLLAYFGMPAAFCVLGYLLLWAALNPVWAMASATAGALVADTAPSFDTRLASVYDPEAAAQVDSSAGYIAGSDVAFPAAGEQYGFLNCERLGLNAPVYWYDSDEILLYGAGQSISSLPPGFGGAIILSGHNTTFFRCLEQVQEGDVVRFSTNWGEYEYAVTRFQVYNENDLETLLTQRALNGDEELILYTCYPFYSITGRKTERFTVFATRTSGLDVKWGETQ